MLRYACPLLWRGQRGGHFHRRGHSDEQDVFGEAAHQHIHDEDALKVSRRNAVTALIKIFNTDDSHIISQQLAGPCMSLEYSLPKNSGHTIRGIAVQEPILLDHLLDEWQ